MPIIPILTFAAGALFAGPLARRVLPVTKAVTQAGLGLTTATLTGAQAVALAIWHGQPHQNPPIA